MEPERDGKGYPSETVISNTLVYSDISNRPHSDLTQPTLVFSNSNDHHTLYVFDVYKKASGISALAKSSTKRRLEVNLEHKTVRITAKKSTKEFYLSEIENISRVGCDSLKVELKLDHSNKEKAYTFRFQSRASLELCYDLLVSSQEGAIFFENFSKMSEQESNLRLEDSDDEDHILLKKNGGSTYDTRIDALSIYPREDSKSASLAPGTRKPVEPLSPNSSNATEKIAETELNLKSPIKEKTDDSNGKMEANGKKLPLRREDSSPFEKLVDVKSPSYATRENPDIKVNKDVDTKKTNFSKEGSDPFFSTSANNRMEPSENIEFRELMRRPQDVLVYTHTWNLGNRMPKANSIIAELPVTRPSDDLKRYVPLYDVYVIGVQENTYDTSATIYKNSRDHWMDILKDCFPENLYCLLTSFDSWDRSLSIYIRNELSDRVSLLETDSCNVGVGGKMGNKGAVCIKFLLYDTIFCFINCHLAAHQSEVSKRNEDYVSIVKGLKRLTDSADVDLTSSIIHHMFWFGDLNYRIDLNHQEVVELIEKEDWSKLLEYDQLSTQMKQAKAFWAFKETKPTFPPTYKYEIGNYTADGKRVFDSDKTRIPSWCDRILWKSLPEVSCKNVWMRDIKSITSSDHTPVCALFKAQLIHISGLRGRGTMMRMMTEEDHFYLIFSKLHVEMWHEYGADSKIVIGNRSLLTHKKRVKLQKEKDKTGKDVPKRVWLFNQEEPVRCQLLENKIEILSKKHLCLTFKDKEHSPGASVILPLKLATSSYGTEKTFKYNLQRYGLPVGIIEGKLELGKENQAFDVHCKNSDSEEEDVKKVPGKREVGSRIADYAAEETEKFLDESGKKWKEIKDKMMPR